MPLIESPRFQPGDLAAWQAAAARDLVWADTPAYRERVEDAELRLYRWGRDKDFYAGTSWGKDSVALAHMLATYLPGKPLVWIREEPTKNPDCIHVRDEFLRRFPRRPVRRNHRPLSHRRRWRSPCHRHAGSRLRRGGPAAWRKSHIRHPKA